MRARELFRRHVALPAEHGAWVFLISPLLIGLFAAGRGSSVQLYLIVAAFCGFLMRHPVTLVIKAYSGRRDHDILPAAWFWIGVYGAVGLLNVAGLVLSGFGFVLYLALPAVPVLVWHLYLVSRRSERRQWLVEVLGAGALASSAPAAYWIGVGRPDPTGWLLWVLTWAQSSASILYAYLRLEQRTLPNTPDWRSRLHMGRTAFVATSISLLLTVGLSVGGIVSRWLFVPYAVQWLEALWGISHPAVGFKPKDIGYRQLAVSAAFTLLFIVAWRL